MYTSTSTHFCSIRHRDFRFLEYVWTYQTILFREKPFILVDLLFLISLQIRPLFLVLFFSFFFFTIEVLNIKKIRKQWYVKKRILKEMDTCVIKDYTNIRNTLEPISLILAFSGIFNLDRYRIFGSR